MVSLKLQAKKGQETAHSISRTHLLCSSTTIGMKNI